MLRASTDRMAGVILGTAVGDALGLPREGLSASRARRMFGSAPLQYRFIFGRGMCSDDTEHTILVAQALLASKGDPSLFAEELASRLRWWLLGCPAGVGLATLRAILKLWCGSAPQNSGVFSAGNGPAMRAAIIGVYALDDVEKLKALLTASTRITHTDPKAENGALAIALAARHAAMRDGNIDEEALFAEWNAHLGDAELKRLLMQVKQALAEKIEPAEFARRLGCAERVSGYMYHTVPAVLFCWLRCPSNFRQAVESVIELGGDADTTGAIAGALAGAAAGRAGIPVELLARLAEWPRGLSFMERLAHSFEKPELMPRASAAALLARNIFFAAVVLAHGLRRLLPPY
ncbi:MAG TPA: ADP-ribosylglycohydrolase family protein [Planctomycetota bacterium]|nr:ADP-ribosylglycohydrolase family protein [Planctomycetota bacterium]